MKKELLFTLDKSSFRIDTFKAGGKGGQHQNKTDSGVRITHIESKISAESRNEKSQYRNKKIAFQKLTKNPKFKLWLNRKVFETTSGKTIEQRVEENLIQQNIKIETKDNEDKWVVNPDLKI